jgi:ribonuclease HI
MSRPSGRPDPDWESLWQSVDAKPKAEPAAEAGPATGPARTVEPAPRRARASGRGLGLIIRTDGAARGNPGPASLGAVLIDASSPNARRSDAPPIATISEFLGVGTNNVAEYTGVVRALDLAEELGATTVDLLLDSKLIVEQVHGRWKVRDAKLIPLHADIRARLGRFERWSARHVPRAQNTQADALCNEAIDRAQAGGARVVVVRPK